VSVYGRSFASKLIQDGKYEDAITEATKAIALEDDNPEHYADRATACVQLGRDLEAVSDFKKALELDEVTQILETDLIDDDMFSALLAAARAEKDTDKGCALLASYRDTLPKGRHVADVDTWTQRLRGTLQTSWSKASVD
jgi:tetratricopeptide (TPR) repeat protein